MADDESILSGLWRRQVGTCCYRNALISCKILRNVILLPRSKFTPVWSKESQKHICIGLDRRMYFDNHHLCYYNDGSAGEPGLVYKLDDRVFKPDLSHKILAVLLYHCHIIKTPQLPEEKTLCLLVLTADGYLKVLDAYSGTLLRSVFLSTVINYRYLLWASYLKTVQVKSTQPSRPRGFPQSSPSPRLMTLAIFRIHPLQLLTCMHIDRTIFGHDISDAFLNEDLLVVRHRNGVLKMYSLPWIIQHCTSVHTTLGEFVELRGAADSFGGIRAGAVGNPGFGLPCTVDIKECPPLLFSARTGKSADISFGGHPTLYLSSSTSVENEFLLKSLQRNELVSVLKADTLAFHGDVAEFHFDDHKRIIHISGCSLSCYRLTYDEWKEKHEMCRVYKTDFRDQLQNNAETMSAVQDVDYENETDLLYAVVTLPDPTSEANMQANLYFINERNGMVLKTVPLPTWEPDGNNSIYYELDCILHLLQNQTSSVCYYYRLT